MRAILRKLLSKVTSKWKSYAPADNMGEQEAESLTRSEICTREELAELARELSHSHVVELGKGSGRNLRRRFKENAYYLEEVYYQLADAARKAGLAF